MEIDVETREVLKLILLPPGGLLILLLIGWFFARRFFGRVLILLATLTLYLLSTPVGLGWLAAQLETIPAATIEQLKQSRAEAILILMADMRRVNPELGGSPALSALSLERLDWGLALHRKTGLPIVLSGGSVKGDTPPLAELGKAWLQERAGVTPAAVETASRDTWENAHNSAETLRGLKFERVLLVTHAFHMPRALLSMQATGIDAVPASFAFEHIPAEMQLPSSATDWLPHPGYLGRSYLILHEMAGLIWYGATRQ